MPNRALGLGLRLRNRRRRSGLVVFDMAPAITLSVPAVLLATGIATTHVNLHKLMSGPESPWRSS